MKIGTLSFFLAGLAFCSNAYAGLFGFGGTNWKEEVLLHDGSKTVVKRSQSYGGKREIGQTPPIKEQDIVFTVQGTSQSITWKSEYGEDIGRSNFLLVALHILRDTPYIVATPNLCQSYNKWGRPNPPYVIFKYEGKDWKRISLQELPVEFKEINLVISTKAEEKAITAQSLVSAELVKKLNSSLDQPEYRSILREAITGLSSDCPIPTTAAGKPIAPEIDGKLLYYNWWPLAKDWLMKTYRGSGANQSINTDAAR